MLNKFRSGWREAFEPKLETLFKTFPDLELIDVKRYYGVLRIKIAAPLDNFHQYVVDCITYKIERDSARICEVCGKNGFLRKEFLPEKMCLCWKCYALEVDAIESSNT